MDFSKSLCNVSSYFYGEYIHKNKSISCLKVYALYAYRRGIKNGDNKEFKEERLKIEGKEIFQVYV